MSLIKKTFDLFFPGARTLRLLKEVVDTTNSTSPIKIATNVTLVVADCCMPPPARLAVRCTAAGSLIWLSFTAPNPITIGSALHMVTEIYELC
jgi:hypothetical protein